MEANGDLERRDSISNLIERLAAELAPDGSGGGQYSPFGSAAPPPPPPHWQTAPPRAPHPHAGSHPLLGGGPLHFGAPPPHAHPPPYQTDRLSGGPPPDPEGELGTAQLSDNLAAHLAGFDAPLFDPRQPPPPAPPGSFLSSWFGGWLGYSPQVPPADLAAPPSPPPPQQHHHTLVERRCAPQVAEVVPPPSPSPPPQQQQHPPPQSQQPPQQPPPQPQQQQHQQQSESCCADPAAAPPSPPPPAPPSPPTAAAPAVPTRPSYSAVLAKPAPAAGPGPRPADTATRQPPGRADSDTPGAGGGGGRRGGRGRRRRVSEAEGRPAREEPSAHTAVGEGAPPRPAQTESREETAEQKKAKSKKLTRTVSAGDAVGSTAAERRADTLNNNPDRAQPPAQRRPLNYNNNLGSSSTLGPAQTHVHAPPPPSPPPPQQQAPVVGDAAKKIDVNVGKQKNCAGKTSNETKKVDATLSKPDNKTLSQSRGPAPVNLLSSSSGAASKSERKELAFRARAGGRTGARGRRTADGGGVGGELVRRLRVQLAPGAALLTAFLSWLLHLVLDVAAMSAELLWTAALGAVRSTRDHVTQWVAAGRAALAARRDAVRAWLAARRGRAAADARKPAGLQENIALPATGDEAMGRLLACRDSDPYSILGVTHDCTDAEIKRYYRRQALLVHPDKSRSPGADEAFKILQRAFQLVGEPDKRAAFDSEAREQHEVNEAFRQYMDEMMSRLREKMEETQNTLRCNNCSRRHRRSRVERPVYAARTCASCQIRHAAREGDIWAESGWLGLFWRYYACMDGGVFDISEWAACQSQSLKHLQANHHTVQYRIISGAKRHRQPADTEPSDRDLEDLLNNLCGGGGGASMSGEAAQQGRRRGARRRPQ